jgi:hypothetical protein
MVQRGMEATSPSKFFGPLAGGACFGSIFIPLCFFFLVFSIEIGCITANITWAFYLREKMKLGWYRSLMGGVKHRFSIFV